MGIAQRLHDETKSLHTAAERSGVMQEMLRGTISPASYAALLVSLRAIYAALEQGLRDHAADPLFAGLDTSAFARTAALEADLTALVGNREGWPAPHAVAAEYAGDVPRSVASAPASPTRSSHARNRSVARTLNPAAGVNRTHALFGSRRPDLADTGPTAFHSAPSKE